MIGTESMTVTISYTAFLLTILTGVAVAALVYLIIVLVRINRAAAKLDGVLGKADDLLGSLKTLADESTGTVVAARQLIDEGTAVAADVAALSAQVRGLVQQDSGQPSFFGRIRSAIAVIAGIKTAVATIRLFLQNRRQSAAGDADN